MKNWRLARSALLAFCAAAFLGGCEPPQPSWRLQARKVGDTIQLCLSHEADCPQPGGVTLDDISVYRYDSTFDNHIVWEASAESPIANDRFEGTVTFGVAPRNWRNKLTPAAVVCGKAYLVNPPATYFALKCDGTVVVFDPTHLEEFFQQEASPAPPK